MTMTVAPEPKPEPKPEPTPPELSITWPQYAAWRVKKCPAPKPDTAVSHATLEFVGEVAEFANVILTDPLCVLRSVGPVVDEAGDVLFTGCWLMDAWGYNYLRSAEVAPSEALVSEKSLVQALEGLDRKVQEALLPALVTKDENPSREAFATLGQFNAYVSQIATGMLIQAGLLANAAKKRDFQGRYIPARPQCDSVFSILCGIQQILYLAGKSIENVLEQNMLKINGRFPEGWKPGGGNR